METGKLNVSDLSKDRLPGSVVYLISGDEMFDAKVIKSFKSEEKVLLLNLETNPNSIFDGKLKPVSSSSNVFEQNISIGKILQTIAENPAELANSFGLFLIRYTLAVARCESLSARNLVIPINPGLISKLKLNEFEKLLNELARNGTKPDYKIDVSLLPIDLTNKSWDDVRKWKTSTKKEICLVSGGIDSTVAARLRMFFKKDLEFFQVRYGQSARNQETWCVQELVKDFKIKKFSRLDMNVLSFFGGSALLDDSIRLKENNLSLEYVPFRNSVFLAFALLKAELTESKFVILGAHPDDTLAPDGRQVYVDSFNSLLNLFQGYPQILAPLLNIGGKPELVNMGNLLGINWKHTWSCHDYIPSNEVGSECRPCGECGNCITRYSAFKLLGKSDVFDYRVVPKLRVKWAGKSKEYDKIVELLKNG